MNIKFITLFLLFCCNLVHAELMLDNTRVIYEEGNQEISINVINSGRDPTLVQSWISDVNSNKNIRDFIITPPLFRLERNSSSPIRILKMKSLPEDRESLFWLNVKGISPSDNSVDNRLSFAINTQIKLIYRPNQLLNFESSSSAYKKLKFIKNNDELIAVNETGYYINLNEIKLGSSELTYKVVPPFSRISWNVTVDSSKEVSWNVVNDFGNISETEHFNLM